MNIVLFGATGQTGMQVVEQALALGHEVKAFVRDPAKMTFKNSRLSIAHGDVTDAKAVDAAIKGSDAVISTLGPKPGSQPALAKGTENIVKSMKKHGVKRLVVQSSYPMSGSPEGMEFLKELGMTPEQIEEARPMIDDKVKQERAIEKSGLDWTIARPLILTNGARTGLYRVGETLPIKNIDTISRADVADFLLKSLTDGKWLRKTVVITY
ncbi:MAG: SDR family oxidoreductase [Candidatus Aenigmarchaeota archaeon]|nr:SDR family oxidoreductase [Candidatus Aenigmarchaeota archaeon]